MEPEAQSYSSVAPAAVTVNPICSPPHSPRRSADVTEFVHAAARRRAIAANGLAKLDENAFAECLDSGKYGEQIQEDLRAGTQAGVNGTPALYVNGIPAPNGALPYMTVASSSKTSSGVWTDSTHSQTELGRLAAQLGDPIEDDGGGRCGFPPQRAQE
jgi:hypothetical protein